VFEICTMQEVFFYIHCLPLLVAEYLSNQITKKMNNTHFGCMDTFIQVFKKASRYSIVQLKPATKPFQTSILLCFPSQELSH